MRIRIRVFRGVDRDRTVAVHELCALLDDRHQCQPIGKREVGPLVGERVGVLLVCEDQGISHALARIDIPGPGALHDITFIVITCLLPERLLLVMGP